MRELETAAADSLGNLAGGPDKRQPAPGSLCPNCQTALRGPYCHVCGQNSDIHKRSLWRLIVESIEGLFHLDGRLRRTLPDLFFHPGRLARDYMEGRIARHVPPFRTFLVALLLFVLAAEHASHRITLANEAQVRAQAADLNSPKGRAEVLASVRKAADTELAGDLKEAADDRAERARAPGANPVQTQARYAQATARAQANYAKAMAEADQLAKTGGVPKVIIGGTDRTQWVLAALRKASENPAYYLTVAFAWGHRAAFLMLPIVAVILAAVYFYKRRFFIHDHLLVAMNFLSFVFLANSLGFILPAPFARDWFDIVTIWTPINLYLTLRGAYGSSRIGAALKALIVWIASFLAFLLLLIGLMVFSLTQI
ncbi:MAG TPA: DUF3667 domain-containing protein [Caulobacteraceae bacterium]